mmetsp:Transcript_155904/g.499844  ORF Transcript_155904/g.499844 Transcript_155904/m.499844 type:complete len:106 (-) Transcript_155904:1064-1381(-)
MARVINVAWCMVTEEERVTCKVLAAFLLLLPLGASVGAVAAKCEPQRRPSAAEAAAAQPQLKLPLERPLELELPLELPLVVAPPSGVAGAAGAAFPTSPGGFCCT